MAKKKTSSKTVEVTKNAKDSKRYLRFDIGATGGEIVGGLYVSKSLKKLPKRIVLDLSDLADAA